jgi:alpha-glucosidase
MHAEAPTAAKGAWWQRGVIYQVYPRSFQDSNGDGIGDLKGITQRLDYLTWLGVDAVWLSPIYPSPMLDFGYDISDYTAVDPIFGTLADFDELVLAAHRRGLKLILDFVPNHTADLHCWFQESRRDRRNSYRDWYIWRDPASDGGPPNNWLSEFGGSAWEYDAATDQYYYHAFLKQQPDLNWRNPALREAMYDVLRFWLNRGVDGFRIDVLHHLIEDAAFRDNPPNPNYCPGMRPSSALLPAQTVDQPEIPEIIARLRHVVDEYPDKVLIGEIHLPIQRLVSYYGVELNGIHLPFNFNLLNARWTATVLNDLIRTYEAALPKGAWPNWVIGNHDISRIVTRVGQDGARLAAMLLLTLRGTPTLYYGDELGMSDVSIPSELVQDPFEKNVPGIGVGRDPARTPMRWTNGPMAGFTGGVPWLPLGPGVSTCNVESQSAAPDSMLSLHRALLGLRRRHPALAIGDYIGFPTDDECLIFIRRHERERILVMLNFSGDRRVVALPDVLNQGSLLFSSRLDRTHGVVTGPVELAAAEGLLIQADN